MFQLNLNSRHFANQFLTFGNSTTPASTTPAQRKLVFQSSNLNFFRFYRPSIFLKNPSPLQTLEITKEPKDTIIAPNDFRSTPTLIKDIQNNCLMTTLTNRRSDIGKLKGLQRKKNRFHYLSFIYNLYVM